VNIQARLDKLTDQLDVLATRQINARKAEDWDLVNELYLTMRPLEQEHDNITQRLQFKADMQAMDDWYDDDKNRDAYNERIVSLYLD
jgi:hypothetical protein